MEHNSDVSKFWRLAETVNVIQAALLIIGVEPQSIEHNVEILRPEQRPQDYIAARNAIVSAIENGVLQGSIKRREIPSDLRVVPSNRDRDLGPDYSISSVSVLSLIHWLDERGFETEAFKLPANAPLGFRDPSHSRYSPKLMAVVDAWESFDSELHEPGTPKQRIMKWLRAHADKYGLIDDRGNFLENVIEELAKVANWKTKGGASRSKQD